MSFLLNLLLFCPSHSFPSPFSVFSFSLPPLLPFRDIAARNFLSAKKEGRSHLMLFFIASQCPSFLPLSRFFFHLLPSSFILFFLVLFRDIAARNFLVSQEGGKSHLMVCDFGLSRPVEDTPNSYYTMNEVCILLPLSFAISSLSSFLSLRPPSFSSSSLFVISWCVIWGCHVLLKIASHGYYTMNEVCLILLSFCILLLFVAARNHTPSTEEEKRRGQQTRCSNRRFLFVE